MCRSSARYRRHGSPRVCAVASTMSRGARAAICAANEVAGAAEIALRFRCGHLGAPARRAHTGGCTALVARASRCAGEAFADDLPRAFQVASRCSAAKIHQFPWAARPARHPIRRGQLTLLIVRRRPPRPRCGSRSPPPSCEFARIAGPLVMRVVVRGVFRSPSVPLPPVAGRDQDDQRVLHEARAFRPFLSRLRG